MVAKICTYCPQRFITHRRLDTSETGSRISAAGSTRCPRENAVVKRDKCHLTVCDQHCLESVRLKQNVVNLILFSSTLRVLKQ